MTAKFTIRDGKGTKNEAKVTSRGQLVVAPLEFSNSYSQTLDVINTAYNVISPITGMIFIITTITVSGNKNIGPDGALVNLYEANSNSSLTVDKNIFTLTVNKSSTIPLPPFNIAVSEGKWLNAKTDDDDINLTITGYYITA